MKARTSKVTILAILGTIFSIGMYAQVPANFQPHGSNSGGTPSPQEATDSITVGGSISYYVEPDAAANPNYNVGGGWALTSTFNWTVDVGTINGAPDTDNNITITASSTATTGTVDVYESQGSCDGPTVSIPVAVIDEPTADFASATNSICQSDTVGGYSVDFDVATATAGNRVTYAIQMDGPNNSNIYSIAATTVDEGTITITIPGGEFDDGVGDYVLSFTEISDHISTKSGVAGTSTTATHTITVSRTPNTGVIYHIPNM